jgi:hypothetical protein
MLLSLGGAQPSAAHTEPDSHCTISRQVCTPPPLVRTRLPVGGLATDDGTATPDMAKFEFSLGHCMETVVAGATDGQYDPLADIWPLDSNAEVRPVQDALKKFG